MCLNGIAPRSPQLRYVAPRIDVFLVQIAASADSGSFQVRSQSRHGWGLYSGAGGPGGPHTRARRISRVRCFKWHPARWLIRFWLFCLSCRNSGSLGFACPGPARTICSVGVTRATLRPVVVPQHADAFRVILGCPGWSGCGSPETQEA